MKYLKSLKTILSRTERGRVNRHDSFGSRDAEGESPLRVGEWEGVGKVFLLFSKRISLALPHLRKFTEQMFHTPLMLTC